MKKTYKRMGTIVAVCGLLASLGPVTAAERSSQEASAQPAAEKSQQELKVSDQQQNKTVRDINKGSKLIGMEVKNTKDETIGKVHDIVLDLQSGKVAYAVVSVGGVFGVGGKLVAVPFNALTPAQGDKGLVINLDKQQAEQAKGFTKNDWPDLDAAQKGQTIGLAAGRQQPAQQQQQQQQESAVGTSPGTSETTGSGQSTPTQDPGSQTPDPNSSGTTDPGQQPPGQNPDQPNQAPDPGTPSTPDNSGNDSNSDAENPPASDESQAPDQSDSGEESEKL